MNPNIRGIVNMWKRRLNIIQLLIEKKLPSDIDLKTEVIVLERCIKELESVLE